MKRVNDNISVYISQLQNEGYSRGKEGIRWLALWILFLVIAAVTVAIVFGPAVV